MSSFFAFHAFRVKSSIFMNNLTDKIAVYSLKIPTFAL